MKKTITLVLILVSVFMIAACSNNQNKTHEALLNKAYEVLTLNFETGDNIDRVTTDFRIPLFVAEFPDVALAWTSSEDTIVKPAGLFVRINRPQSDTPVTLTATLSYIKAHKEKDFELNITGYANDEFTGYYAELNGLSREALKLALTTMIKTTGSQSGSTAQVKSIDNYNGINYNIYTGFGDYGNREHVVPASLFRAIGAKEDDLHNLRAAVVSVNTSRANYPFTNTITDASWKLVDVSGKKAFYPGEEHIGDVARIVLYITLRNGIKITEVGTLQMFLDWHEQDPINDFEISRNGKIEAIQKSRNPFIDHPGLVEVLFS